MTGYPKDLAETFAGVADDRRITVFPLLLERIRELSAGGRLLDYGGGNGEFAVLAGDLPLAGIVTYDLSPAMTELAAGRLERQSRLVAVGATSDLGSQSFDVVTCNGVWMCWSSQEECIVNLSEIARLLTPGGTLLASVTHPCFRDRRFSTYRTDFDPVHYLDDGTRFHVRVFDGVTEVELEDTHWSLSSMTRQLQAAGLQLTLITEVADRSGVPGSPWMIVEASRAGR
jgi:SAM-dependent methyltransferase